MKKTKKCEFSCAGKKCGGRSIGQIRWLHYWFAQPDGRVLYFPASGWIEVCAKDAEGAERAPHRVEFRLRQFELDFT
jgi:hypothetical protein